MNLTVIQNKIYEIGGQKVMLDYDLAALYEVETKRLNEQVKRNLSRFPEDFMFRVTPKEWKLMRSQFATASEIKAEEKSKSVSDSQNKRNAAITPYAFTEHGVTMLASVLRSEKAVNMNIAIVRAFIAMRQLAIQHKDLATQLNQLRDELNDRIGEHDAQLNAIYNAIEKLLDKKAEIQNWEERERIGFKK